MPVDKYVPHEDMYLMKTTFVDRPVASRDLRAQCLTFSEVVLQPRTRETARKLGVKLRRERGRKVVPPIADVTLAKMADALTVILFLRQVCHRAERAALNLN